MMTRRQIWAAIVVAVLLGTLLAAALLVGVNILFDRAKCDAYSVETGRDTRYIGLVGCMVKSPLGWVPQDEIRQVIRVDQKPAQ